MGGWRVCDACRIRACYRRMVHAASGVAGDLGGTVGDGPLARRASAIRAGNEDRVGLERRVGEVRSWRAEPRPCSGPFLLAHQSVRCAECSAVMVLPRVRFYVDSTEGSPLVRPHNAALARTQWAYGCFPFESANGKGCGLRRVRRGTCALVALHCRVALRRVAAFGVSCKLAGGMPRARPNLAASSLRALHPPTCRRRPSGRRGGPCPAPNSAACCGPPRPARTRRRGSGRTPRRRPAARAFRCGLLAASPSAGAPPSATPRASRRDGGRIPSRLCAPHARTAAPPRPLRASARS
jgi:hypothetical protein